MSTDEKCAPSIKDDGISCMSLDELLHLSSAYNKYIDDHNLQSDRINLNNISTINRNNNKQDTSQNIKIKRSLVSQLNKKLKNICNDQMCWLKQDFMKYTNDEYRKKLLYKTFRPVGPSGKFDWLSTTNINQVMTQYEDKYKEFHYLGTFPLDFQTLNYIKISYEKIRNLITKDNKKVFGIVYNLDKHDEPGSHWVASYLNFSKKPYTIEYFDSVGSEPPIEILNFMNFVKSAIIKCKCIDTNPEIKLLINNIKHQLDDSECGVYSINFIVKRLDGVEFKDITNNIIRDHVINKERDKLFN